MLDVTMFATCGPRKASMEDDLDNRISHFLQTAEPASIDLGSLVENAEDTDMGINTRVRA